MTRTIRLFTLMALAAVALCPALATARCMSGYLTAWPPADTALPTQPMILVDGFGDRQTEITELAEGGVARLVAGKHRIELKVEAVHVGAFGLTQAVLSPTAPLKPSTRYRLELRTADGRRVPTTRFAEDGVEPIGWTTAGVDAGTAPLTLTSAPKVTGQSYRRLGCGPSSRVEVSLPATSSTALAVEVRLKELGADGAMQTYVVPVVDGQVSLGHGMCSGAFRLTGAERRFRAELVVRDAGGDAVAAPEALTFSGVDPMGGFGRFR